MGCVIYTVLSKVVCSNRGHRADVSFPPWLQALLQMHNSQLLSNSKISQVYDWLGISQAGALDQRKYNLYQNIDHRTCVAAIGNFSVSMLFDCAFGNSQWTLVSG